MMNKEKLSQLLDNELSVNETEAVLDSLLDDPKLQRAWLAQYTARAAIRENTVHASLDIVDRVATALEDETPIIAPENLPRPDTAISPPGHADLNNVASIITKPRRVMAYAAMAASVAALLYVAYLPEKSLTPDVAEVKPRVLESQQIENEMQSMIVQHGEFSGAAALNGLVAYSKVVNGSTGTAGQ